jgi:hypothetical protein
MPTIADRCYAAILLPMTESMKIDETFGLVIRGLQPEASR